MSVTCQKGGREILKDKTLKGFTIMMLFDALEWDVYSE